MHQSDKDVNPNLFDAATQAVNEGDTAENQAEYLYDQLTEDEQLQLLDGDIPFWIGRLSIIEHGYNRVPFVMGQIERVGIPGIRFVDGPRGCVSGNGTAFPVAMARGATWDADLEERVGEAIGAEIRAEGGNLFGGVCINLPRNPQWGRIQETYSDQSLVLGSMGAALVTGVRHHVMACVKHFACNSMENARFKVDVSVSDQDFHDFYAPHFKQAIDAGADAVMTAYNSVNGEFCGQNPHLIKDVLRKEWGFTGIVVSDFVWGIRDVAKSIRAGLDIEEPFMQQRHSTLRQLLDKGDLSRSDIRPLGMRIIETQLRFYAQRAVKQRKNTISRIEHIQLAREVAGRSMVLLKNRRSDTSTVLPLIPQQTKRVLVTGKLALSENTGDEGSSKVRYPYAVTPLQGIEDSFENSQVRYVDEDRLCENPLLAESADAVIVVVGYTANDEGEYLKSVIAPDMLPLLPEPASEEEQSAKDDCFRHMGEGKSTFGGNAVGGDRRSTRLNDNDVALIQQVSQHHDNTIVVMMNAGAVLMDDWVDDPAAILMSWYPGMEGGHALGDILSGRRDPSGRLPYAIPFSEEDLPDFDRDATQVRYDGWYGQRLIEKRGSEALFPLGFGLSYNSYHIEDATLEDLDQDRQTATISVAASNHGEFDGHLVVQIYGRCDQADARETRELLGFSVASIPADGSNRIHIPIDFTPLSTWDAQQQSKRHIQGKICIEVSSYWGDPDAKTMEVTL